MENLIGSTPTLLVLQEVSERKNVEVTELDPLYEYIDPDALDQLVEHGFIGEITFGFEGYWITIDSNGEIDVSESSSIELSQ